MDVRLLTNGTSTSLSKDITMQFPARRFVIGAVVTAAVVVSLRLLWTSFQREFLLDRISQSASRVGGIGVLDFNITYTDPQLTQHSDVREIVDDLSRLGALSNCVSVTFDGVHLTDNDCSTLANLQNVSSLSIANADLSEVQVSLIEHSLRSRGILFSYERVFLPTQR